MTLQSEVLSTFDQIYSSNAAYGQYLTFYPLNLQIGDIIPLTYSLGDENYESINSGGLTTTYIYYSDVYIDTANVSENVSNQFGYPGTTGYFSESLSLNFNLDPTTLEIQGINYGYYTQDSDIAGRVTSDSFGNAGFYQNSTDVFIRLDEYYYVDSSSNRLEYSISTSVIESNYTGNTYSDTQQTIYTYDYGTLTDSEITSIYTYDARYGVTTSSTNSDINYTKDSSTNTNSTYQSEFNSVSVDSVTGRVKNSSYNLNSGNYNGKYSYSYAFTSDYDGDGLIDYYSTINSNTTASGTSISNSLNLSDYNADGIADFVSIDIRQSSPLGGKYIQLAYSDDSNRLDITRSSDFDGDGIYDVSRTKSIPVLNGLQYSMPTDHVVDLVDVVDPTLI